MEPQENLGLYSGYGVGTQAESYAWIDLDKVKLARLDAGSEIEIAKEGKKLEINVKSGSMFFNVNQPLTDDETMDITTSTMMLGIRGTCGWVTESTAALLEGIRVEWLSTMKAGLYHGIMNIMTILQSFRMLKLCGANILWCASWYPLMVRGNSRKSERGDRETLI